MGDYTGSSPTDPTVGSKGSVSTFGISVADALQAILSAGSSWTPTLTNVTGGTVSCSYQRWGKMVHVSIEFTAGTATAAGTVGLTMPGGSSALRTQGLLAMNAGTLRSARVTTTNITLAADTSGANFGAGASLVSTRINGWVEVS